MTPRPSTTSVRFRRTDRAGTFEVTARAEFRVVAVTPTTAPDWQRLADRLTANPPRSA